MDEDRKREMAENRERMTTLRRNIGNLKGVTAELSRKLEEDLLEIDYAKKETELGLGRINQTILRMKEVSGTPIMFWMIVCGVVFSGLLLLMFLFRT
ncbi:hypothetical protein NEHOM01_1040 [Nematocida homosporus]|uniref:uncharacterized protein n=1 Tax=Nematocida homosporus TaxID=1912981 RepID=UPI0022200733|nr:uncharacterized protein NEHOM01_1040 [Nematocida homosporus]KAI5185763.1 hypothetical protein NEHOM01_1040 [Nematocida homosporus]